MLNVVLLLALAGGPTEVTLPKPATKYWIHVPEDYDAARKYPMLVVLHGAGSSAESFIKVWPRAVGFGWILVAVKSRGQAWEDSDGEVILGVMDAVRKSHSIDNERVFLIGYSSGGFMACRFGLKNHAQFRVMGAVAGAQEASAKGAREHLSIVIACGEYDPNLATCKRVAKNFDKQGFDTEFKEIPKMEHSPITAEAIDWMLDRVRARDLSYPDIVKRGKTAEKEKRYADLAAQWRAFLETKPEGKFAKKAEEEIARIEKLGDDRLAEAERQKDPAAVKKMLEEIVRRFAGLEAAKKAAKRLEDLR